MTIPCYQCGKAEGRLSPRSRCANCEYQRSMANEAENERLRQELGKSQVALTLTMEILSAALS